MQQRSYSFVLRLFRRHWQCCDRFFRRKPVRHLITKRSLQKPIGSNILQNDLLVQRRDNRYLSCKHAGIRLMNLKLDMDNPEDRARNCAGPFSISSPGEKCESENVLVEILSFDF
jgi:hypothetical protein